MLLVSALACRPLRPLEDTPVLGGTPELRERVRAELAAFDAAVGPGRVELRKVVFVDGGPNVRGDDVAGAYGLGRVELAADDPQVTLTLRHELCHAVHVTDGLLDDPDPLWDEVAAGLFTLDPTYVSAREAGHYHTADRQRHEAMASFCELGADALAALLDPCPGESPLQVDLARWLLDEVYREVEPPGPVVDGPITTLDGWSPTEPTVSAADVEGVVAVGDGLAADLVGGQRLELDVTAVPEEDPGVRIRGVYTSIPVGYPDGPAATRGSSWLHHLQWSAPRLYVAGEGCVGVGCWSVPEGECAARDGEALFTAGGGLYRSWRDGFVVRWARL